MTSGRVKNAHWSSFITLSTILLLAWIKICLDYKET